jgi:CheY-like chemotaxis protein
MNAAAAPLHRVACVDDDPDILVITKLALEEVGGLVVIDFPGPRAVIEGLAAAKPDLILMDVMMPEIDGPAALRLLREGGSNVPVVFMTARVQSHEVANYIALGAAGVISKPFDPLTLAQKLDDIWRKAVEG